MTAYIAGGVVLVLVVVGVVWSRLRAGHSDRRSMETYGHGLAALGDVTRRTGSASSVKVLPGQGEVARTHLRQEAPSASGVPTHPPAAGAPLADGTDERAPVPPTEAPPLPRWRPSVSIPVPEDELRFEDAGTAQGGSKRSPREPPFRAGGAPGSFGRPGDGLGRQSPGRKLAVGGTAVVAVAAIVVAAILLTLHPGRHAGPGTTTTTPATSTTTSTTVSTTTTTPPVVSPVSTTASSATFALPSGRYTLRFVAGTSACWVGIEPSPGAGTYLWTETVQAGSSGHYRATGPVAVQLGAPEYVSVTLDGVPVKIPSDVTYYELIFASS